MKDVKVILFLILFIAFSSAMGQVTVLFDKTFDAEATGADPADFELIEEGTGNVTIAEFPSFIDKSLLTQSMGDGDVRATLPINIDQGILTIEFDWYFNKQKIQFQIEGDLVEGGNDDVCQLFSYRNDLDTNMVVISSFPQSDTRVPIGYFGGPETWVKIKVVLSLDDPWIQYFVNDTLRYADLPKKSRVLANTTGILWKHGGTIENYVNNLKVTHVQQSGGPERSSYGLFAEMPEYNLDGSFLTDATLSNPAITTSSGGVFEIVTDDVKFGTEALHVTFAGGGGDRVKFEVENPADFSVLNNTGVWVFWVKLLDPVDISIEVESYRNGDKISGSDESLAGLWGLDLDNPDWQEIRIDLSHHFEGNVHEYQEWKYLGFRSRDNASNFLVDEVYVTYAAGGTDVERDNAGMPGTYVLNQNYPNPFNPSTTLSYSLAKTADVELNIYSMLGQKVRTLVNASRTAGDYTVKWDGINDSGEQVTGGVYLLQLRAGDFKSTRKMLLMK